MEKKEPEKKSKDVKSDIVSISEKQEMKEQKTQKDEEVREDERALERADTETHANICLSVWCRRVRSRRRRGRAC